MQSDSGLNNCPAGGEELEKETRKLVTQFLTDFAVQSAPRFGDGKALSTMKRVVDGLCEKHRYKYNGMIQNMALYQKEEDVAFVSAVAASLFEDCTVTWGRIASLMAFGAVVCKHLKERGSENSAEQVGQEISSYLLSHHRGWMLENNSWDGFAEYFQAAEPEMTMRNTLISLAGLAGLGATLALLIKVLQRILQ
ncbi:induced myeloid leukemia cell differentiation protein Mcl-1 homolog [Solea solea]|uniref:induced myeloid leukemia cell differentiation protein Mcl-1 homolog n=1 Tax=Solea solea TaxID=90069 RepID=UPI0027296FE8|nr:induced myeloid leukemia cell differentiation protein Mcl-1 homolog [Solea solea]